MLIIGVEGDKLTPITRVDREWQKLGFWKKENAFQFDQFTPDRERAEQSESYFGVDTLVITIRL